MSAMSPTRTYEGAIDVLNTLQTPFAVIEARRKAGIRPDENSIKEMRAYLARLGYTSQDLDRLNIIHVAGTKGKGSTCAFADSILTHHARTHAHAAPRKIGLLTSPHLVAVRERIRIDSAPLSRELFARYFFEVWDRLETSGAAPDAAELKSKPIYARYLTLLAFHVFLREGVDCAVFETGVGGEYDATNVVDHPVATGISTLGIDHTFVLGNTLEKIAWHKAGIMKEGCAAFAVEQLGASGAEGVLRSRAREKRVDLRVLGIDSRLEGVKIRPDAAFQKRNASLAVALAETAIKKLDSSFVSDSTKLPQDFVDGLQQVVWRGRCEVKEEGNVLWHIDGAHTTDSLKMAAKWFAGECAGRSGPRILIFNQQGRTEAIDFLDGLFSATKTEGGSSFEHVIFCTNITFAETGYKRDFVNHQYDADAIKKLTVQRTFADRWSSLDPKANVMVIASIEEAINQARSIAKSTRDGETIQALITGSLHLVGGALGILEGVDAL